MIHEETLHAGSEQCRGSQPLRASNVPAWWVIPPQTFGPCLQHQALAASSVLGYGCLVGE